MQTEPEVFTKLQYDTYMQLFERMRRKALSQLADGLLGGMEYNSRLQDIAELQKLIKQDWAVSVRTLGALRKAKLELAAAPVGSEEAFRLERKVRFLKRLAAMILEGSPREQAAERDGSLNQWEQQYQRDKADKHWPADAAFYDVEPTYESYLEVLLREGEMTEVEYLAEMQRLREGRRGAEDSAVQWAGINTLHQGQRKYRQVFKRGTRFNQTTV